MYTLNKTDRKKFLAIHELIGTGFFTGYLPVAPGTWGTWSAACLFSILCGWFDLSSSIISIVGCICCLAVGVPASHALVEENQEKDPSFIVIDEWAGTFVTYSLVSFDPMNIIYGFALFRLFDIIKPWPIKIFEGLKGGWGVMSDDIVAGIYAALGLYLLQFFSG